MKKLSKIFAVAMCLALVLSMLPLGAAAAEEKYVELTVDTMGLADQSYADGAANIGGVAISWFHVGNYGDGIQMRDKESEGKGPSKIWNSAALPGKITKVELTYSDSKNTYDNPDCMIWNFGNSEKGADYSTTLSTVSGTKEYTITPAGDYSFFYLEWDYGYTSYWKSIKIYYTEGGSSVGGGDVVTPPAGGDNTQEPPKDTGDHTAIVTMTAVMSVAAVAMFVLVIGKKKFF